MNQEAISQICFSQRFTVQPHQTAAALFAAMPFGARHASRMAPVLGSAELLAQLESLCIDALHPLVQWPQERVLGTALKLEHRAAVQVGQTVQADGFVIGLGDHSATFCVRARVDDQQVAEATLTFVVVNAAWRPMATRGRRAVEAQVCA